MVGVWDLTPLLGEKSLQVGGVDSICLLFDQAVNAVLLLLVHSVAMCFNPPLGCLCSCLSILKALLDAVLLIQGERRLDLVHHSLVLSHYFEGLLDVALKLSSLLEREVCHVALLVCVVILLRLEAD